MVSDHQLCSIYQRTQGFRGMTCTLSLLSIALIVAGAWSWEALPQIPTGRRSQFLVLHGDGGYKYGYDTGDGSAAKQSGDAANQVEGHYFLKTPTGQDIDLKYTAGVQGFVPEGLEKIQRLASVGAPSSGPPPGGYSYPAPAVPVISAYSSASSDGDTSDDQAGTGDASYNFSFDTDSYNRQESSDARGNIQGRYSYTNNAGVHDLQYIAGENTGFVATSGSLSLPNGLKPGQGPQTYQAPSPAASGVPGAATAYNAPYSQGSSPGSGYSFSYSTGDSSRQESSDASGNVQGRYSYQNAAGSHDLSFVAGAETGFQPTGGSLSLPNGLQPGQGPQTYQAPSGTPAAVSVYNGASAPFSQNSPSGAGYSFAYSTGDSSRQESSDVSGNVQGRYSYQDAAGSHDLSFVAGAQTGFQPTGGSLSVPNGLGDGAAPAGVPAGVASSRSSVVAPADVKSSPDGSYSFNYNTDDHSRQESGDAAGNVVGRYAYSNNAGHHDLSYVAGSNTGFQVTGGSLAQPNGLGDAGPAPGALPASVSYIAPAARTLEDGSGDDGGNQDDQANTGDASYSFSVDTGDYKRTESSDAGGNVRGSFSYSNAAGNHDLSFVAGAETGFLPTGGSLKTPPGASEVQLGSGAAGVQSYAAKSSVFALPSPLNSIAPSTKTSYSVGNAKIHTYLPPSNEKNKFGYIYDTA